MRRDSADVEGDKWSVMQKAGQRVKVRADKHVWTVKDTASSPMFDSGDKQRCTHFGERTLAELVHDHKCSLVGAPQRRSHL